MPTPSFGGAELRRRTVGSTATQRLSSARCNRIDSATQGEEDAASWRIWGSRTQNPGVYTGTWTRWAAADSWRAAVRPAGEVIAHGRPVPPPRTTRRCPPLRTRHSSAGARSRPRSAASTSASIGDGPPAARRNRSASLVALEMGKIYQEGSRRGAGGDPTSPTSPVGLSRQPVRPDDPERTPRSTRCARPGSRSGHGGRRHGVQLPGRRMGLERDARARLR